MELTDIAGTMVGAGALCLFVASGLMVRSGDPQQKRGVRTIVGIGVMSAGLSLWLLLGS